MSEEKKTNPFERFEVLAKKVDRANPRKEDIQALEKIYNSNPGLWKFTGDIVYRAQWQLVTTASENSKSLEIALYQAIDEMKEGLGFEDSSLLEKLLIDQVMLCWLDMYDVQFKYRRIVNAGTSFKNADHWEKRLNGSHRRYLNSIKALARIRKLGPALQINIADQQINQVMK